MDRRVFTRGFSSAFGGSGAVPDQLTMTLDRLKPGHYAHIIRIDGMGEVRRRLFDMGLTPHALVKMDKLAPLGDPMLISLRGYTLCLRKAEARSVVVRIFDDNSDWTGNSRFRMGK